MKCFYCGKPASQVMHGESMCDECIGLFQKIALWAFGIIVLIIILSNIK